MNFNTDINQFLNKLSTNNKQNFDVVGVDNLFSCAYLLSEFLKRSSKSPLVVVPNEKSFLELKNCLQFLDSTLKVNYLPSFGAQMYSELTPPVDTVYKRLHWIANTQKMTDYKDSLLVATPQALLQRTLPQTVFYENSFDLTKGEELPESISKSLLRKGYNQTPLVEDPGTFALRGGILDIFSPAYEQPLRLELFGDTIESIKYFNPNSGRSNEELNHCTIIPAKETLLTDENRQLLVKQIKDSALERSFDDQDVSEIQQDIVHWKYFLGCEYFPNYFYKETCYTYEYLTSDTVVFHYNKQLQLNNFDKLVSSLKEHEKYNKNLSVLLPAHVELYNTEFDSLNLVGGSSVSLAPILMGEVNEDTLVNFSSNTLNEFTNQCKSLSLTETGSYLKEKIAKWKQQDKTLFFASQSESNIKKFQLLCEDNDLQFEEIESLADHNIENEVVKQNKNSNYITLIKKDCPYSVEFKYQNIVYITLENIFGKENHSKRNKQKKNSFKKAKSLHFADLKINDFIVHRDHGVGVYKGLTIMKLGEIEAEYLQLEYKDKDKLYLPIYRIGQIQKFTGAGKDRLIDKLGGKSFEKAKIKVKSKLKDIAADLLKLYAERQELTRPPLPEPDQNFNKFVKLFPFTETNDQLNAVEQILNDQSLDKPMDRLVCGDVGFGKTEVAMRAAFQAAYNGQQVAVIAPTTILTFQHFETFKKRFQPWDFEICCLNRFVSTAQIKKNKESIKSGKAKIVIGTHRLFSKDIEFNNLGLLIIDEEQKFGVKHKEKIRTLKKSVDTLTLSATPIPRTLNMSFLGLRDFSLITTPPVDRLPIRTFLSKYDLQTIRRAITNEIDRGGQVFFLHNRVNNIETIASELREELPSVRFAIGHGQMKETDLEKVMVSFYDKKVDVLISTTIIESGMDIPNANTIIINNAQNLGLSQLYQIRGRVGRSTKRAYCYLMVPQKKPIDKTALERLKVIQQNTELGSGITIAQYDLELRGSGDLLGESQSGHINAVGYELYMDLLKEAIAEQKGEPATHNQLEPEINLRIPSLFPDKYMSDIRLRLSYYKRLSDIDSMSEIDDIEDELREQFGKPPEQVQNLLGIMLIRFMCKKLCIQDLSEAKKGITLSFTSDTPLSTEQVFQLAQRADEKYKLTPESKLLVHIKNKTWERIFEELTFLAKKCDVDF